MSSIQRTFSEGDCHLVKKQTPMMRFLLEMDAVIPWSRLVGLVRPYYPRAGRRGGRPAYDIEQMLRIYCLQQFYNLGDPTMECKLYEVSCMRDFAGVSLDDIPDETTILHFRHLLMRHHLQQRFFDVIGELLRARGLQLRAGTLVDATIIEAPRSTKNQRRRRDPAMSSMAKGKQWYYGMKAHVGMDQDSGTVHSLVTTTASEHESRHLLWLLHGEEQACYGDKAYDSVKLRGKLSERGVSDRLQRRIVKGLPATERARRQQWNKQVGGIRAKVEHTFRIVKCQFGYHKVRYKGLSKNTAQLFALFTLANLYQMRYALMDT